MNQSNAVPETTPSESNPLDYDYAREEAVYQRERERLVREHPGKFALIRGDELVGVFATFDEAIAEGGRRFGWVPIMIRDIVADEEASIYLPHTDRHP